MCDCNFVLMVCVMVMLIVGLVLIVVLKLDICCFYAFVTTFI